MNGAQGCGAESSLCDGSGFTFPMTEQLSPAARVEGQWRGVPRLWDAWLTPEGSDFWREHSPLAADRMNFALNGNLIAQTVRQTDQDERFQVRRSTSRKPVLIS